MPWEWGQCCEHPGLGGILFEIPLWCILHYTFGPSILCYLCMYLTAGAIFVPCSQVAHVILYPNSNKYDSWAKMQIAESVDFASESDFWFHMAFGLTTQIEHHLFPGIGHHCYDTIRHITRDVCKKHGVLHQDVSASTAFSFENLRLPQRLRCTLEAFGGRHSGRPADVRRPEPGHGAGLAEGPVAVTPTCEILIGHTVRASWAHSGPDEFLLVWPPARDRA
eukprot:s3384_g4.t1